MPSGHVTGGAPPGTGKEYQSVLLLSADHKCLTSYCLKLNAPLYHSCIKLQESLLSGIQGLLPLQSLSPAPGAGQGMFLPTFSVRNRHRT